MGKEDRVGISTGSLEQCEFSLDQLLGQEEHQSDFASYLAGVNQRRSELEFDELTGNETGVKLAFALKDGQFRLRGLAFNYLEVRDRLLYQGMDPKELSLDLAACDLSDTDLRWFHLREVDLRQANLSKANLSKADLQKANLSEANLSEADLIRVHLWNADLSKANLNKVNLFAADLLEANLTAADLSGATLGRANLSGTDLQGANFKWANLGLTNFTKVNFEKANLKEVNLLDSILTASEANFTGAELGEDEIEDLNKLDQAKGDLLQDALGLVRDGSSKIIGVESLPDHQPQAPKIQPTNG